MARISTYTIDGSIDGTEFVLGREADGTTKQFSMSALQTYLATTISPTTVFASIDVNGGTIDGTVIGGSSAAAGSFTTISASSNATITGNATVGGTLGVTGVTTLVDANVTGELNFDGSAGTAGYYLKSSGDGVTPVWDQLSLNDLADEIGLSLKKLKEGFKQIYGDSVYSFLIDYKMELARKLLESGDYNVNEVGLKIGYSTSSHFIAAFKKKYGVTPKKYLISLSS